MAAASVGVKIPAEEADQDDDRATERGDADDNLLHAVAEVLPSDLAVLSRTEMM